MNQRLFSPLAAGLLALLACAATAPCWGVEHVTLRDDSGERKISGKLLVEAQDGGVLLLAPDTRLWAIEPEKIVARSHDDQPFVPLEREALAQQLLTELPEGFQILHTDHYVICYDTSRAYAEWSGQLYERLFNAFYKYWEDRNVELKPPEVPLVALVFQTKQSYADYARQELGAATEAIVGYYSLQSNRVMMYDLTGVEGAKFGDRAGFSARVNAILARPDAEMTVATIIHEATHQLAFNSGMQQRLADIPLWLSEGMAVYFETPDLKNSRGWTKVGAVNQQRLVTFRRYLQQRPADSLATLISSDDRFRDTKTAPVAYAEAWAFNYYLIRNHKQAYAQYLKLLADKGPLLSDGPEERLKQFTAIFGDDLERLDAAFVKYMLKVRL
jgi:hypothetical protein